MRTLGIVLVSALTACGARTGAVVGDAPRSDGGLPACDLAVSVSVATGLPYDGRVRAAVSIERDEAIVASGGRLVRIALEDPPRVLASTTVDRDALELVARVGGWALVTADCGSIVWLDDELREIGREPFGDAGCRTNPIDSTRMGVSLPIPGGAASDGVFASRELRPGGALDVHAHIESPYMLGSGFGTFAPGEGATIAWLAPDRDLLAVFQPAGAPVEPAIVEERGRTGGGVSTSMLVAGTLDGGSRLAVLHREADDPLGGWTLSSLGRGPGGDASMVPIAHYRALVAIPEPTPPHVSPTVLHALVVALTGAEIAILPLDGGEPRYVPRPRDAIPGSTAVSLRDGGTIGAHAYVADDGVHVRTLSCVE